MSTRPDGGPAFPLVITRETTRDTKGGMSLRDYFAGQALAGLTVGLVGELKSAGQSVVSAYAHGPCNAELANRAYAAADAMLAARTTKEKS